MTKEAATRDDERYGQRYVSLARVDRAMAVRRVICRGRARRYRECARCAWVREVRRGV